MLISKQYFSLPVGFQTQKLIRDVIENTRKSCKSRPEGAFPEGLLKLSVKEASMLLYRLNYHSR